MTIKNTSETRMAFSLTVFVLLIWGSTNAVTIGTTGAGGWGHTETGGITQVQETHTGQEHASMITYIV